MKKNVSQWIFIWLYLKYTNDGIFTISYFCAASWLAIFTKSIPNISASPSICSNSSRISSHSAQSESSVQWKKNEAKSSKWNYCRHRDIFLITYKRTQPIMVIHRANVPAYDH